MIHFLEIFYSDSDSDSDHDEQERKIRVEIKPLNGIAPISASVDELRATVESLSLSPLGGALSVSLKIIIFGISCGSYNICLLLHLFSLIIVIIISLKTFSSLKHFSLTLINIIMRLFVSSLPFHIQARHGSNSESDSLMKRSHSVSQQFGDKPSSDLLGLNLFQQHQSPGASNASTPTATHPYAPLQSPTLSVSRYTIHN